MSEKITAAEYRALAELRYRIRLLLREGDATALSEGLEPQQYQMLLAIRGLEEGESATVGTLAERLAIKHHSAVELIDRLEKRGFVKRLRNRGDRRQVQVILLLRGEKAKESVNCALPAMHWSARSKRCLSAETANPAQRKKGNRIERLDDLLKARTRHLEEEQRRDRPLHLRYLLPGAGSRSTLESTVAN